jgi:hypothetical protein
VQLVTQIHPVQALIMCGFIPFLIHLVRSWCFIKYEKKYTICHLQIGSKNRTSSYSIYTRRQKLCRSWLRHSATRREVPGSIPDRVLVKFQIKYSVCPQSVALCSTRRLKEISTSYISCGIKAAGALQLTSLPSFWCRMSK